MFEELLGHGLDLSGLLLQVGFDADRERDFVAECFAHHGWPIYAKVRFVDDDGGFPAGKLRALHARAEGEEFGFEHDFFAHALNGEVAGDIEGVFARFFPRFAFERGGGELRGVKKIWYLQMRVTFFVGGVDARDFDGGFDGRFFEVGAINDDGAGELGERAWYFAHKMSDAESDGGVDRVDLVGFDSCGSS